MFGDKLRLCSLLLVFLVVMMSPAFAVEMEEVAHHAEEYNKESQKKHGFFGKIKFLAKGFKLIGQAKKAEKDADKKKNEVEDSIVVNDENLVETHNQKVLDREQLIEYQANKKQVNDTVFNSDSSVPSVCMVDAKDMIRFLSYTNVFASLEEQDTIDTNLTNNLVQIIDNGYIHYVQVTNVTLEGNNTGVTVNTGFNTVFYTLPKFRELYDGIKLNLDEKCNVSQVLDSLIAKQKNALYTEKDKVKTLHDKARNQVIIWGILIGVAVILIIVGVILTLYCAYQLTQIGKVPQYVARIKNTARAEEYLAEQQAHGQPPAELQDIPKIGEKIVNELCRGGQFEDVGATIVQYARFGVAFTLVMGPQVVLNVASQNWVQVVLCVVGVILVLIGIGLIIAGIIKTVQNAVKWHKANVITRRNNYDSDRAAEWLG